MRTARVMLGGREWRALGDSKAFGRWIAPKFAWKSGASHSHAGGLRDGDASVACPAHRGCCFASDGHHLALRG